MCWSTRGGTITPSSLVTEARRNFEEALVLFLETVSVQEVEGRPSRDVS